MDKKKAITGKELMEYIYIASLERLEWDDIFASDWEIYEEES